jgi:hypothetical protein
LKEKFSISQKTIERIKRNTQYSTQTTTVLLKVYV